MSDDLDYWQTHHPKCPHCGNVQQDYADKIAEWEDGGTSEITCEDCRKPFVCVITTNVVFSTAVDEEAASDEIWGPRKANETV